MNQNFNYSNSFGFDQIQPPQQFDNHHPQEIPEVISFIDSETKNELYKMMEDFTERVNQELRKQEVLLAAQREQELLAQKQAAQENALNSKLLSINSQHLDKEKQKKITADRQLNIKLEYFQSVSVYIKNFKVIYKENIIPLNKTPQISPSIALAPVFSIMKPEDSLSMGDEHLNTIPEKESDELMKSSVENLVPIPSESKDISEDECELPLCDYSSETQFSTFFNPLFDSNDDFSSSDDESFSKEDVPMEEFKIYSNPLFDFDEEIISSEENLISNEVLDEINSIGMNDYFNSESDLIESLRNRDTSIDSFHKIDSLFDEFADKLTLLKPISPEIDNSDFDPEGEIRIIEKLLYDNSSPLPLENLSIESFSPSPIPVEDSNSYMEDIDLFLAFDNLMPPGIKNDDYDSEGDIRFLEELLSNDPLPLPEIKSSNLDHFNDPSSPRPPPEPPDVEICFDVEPDTTTKNDFEELNEDECFDRRGG
ncbi:hypothetical protein Tco_1482949 [Tanacetum coccineum]